MFFFVLTGYFESNFRFFCLDLVYFLLVWVLLQFSFSRRICNDLRRFPKLIRGTN